MEKEKKMFINTLVDIFQMSTAGFSCNAVAPSFTLQYSRSCFNNQKFISSVVLTYSASIKLKYSCRFTKV